MTKQHRSDEEEALGAHSPFVCSCCVLWLGLGHSLVDQSLLCPTQPTLLQIQTSSAKEGSEVALQVHLSANTGLGVSSQCSINYLSKNNTKMQFLPFMF